ALETEQQDEKAEDRRQDGSADEDVGSAHWRAAVGAAAAGSISLSMTTTAPFDKRFCPAVTTSSPASIPCNISTRPALRRPTVTKTCDTRNCVGSPPAVSPSAAESVRFGVPPGAASSVA